jgi:DedD protein
MGLFSFLSKNKQESAAGEGEFYSRAEGDARPRTRNTRKSAKSGKAGKADAGGRGAGADDEPLDPVLPEKKRARRRLVGAVALVLAMIIGLPMILDSEPKPMADDIAIQIPSRDKPPVIAPAASAAATAASTSAVPVAASLDPREQVVAMPPVATGTAGAKPPAASIPASDATPKNGKPDAKPESKPEAKPDAKPPEPVRNAVGDKQESKPDSKPADKTGDKQVAKLEHKQDQKTEQKDEARAAAILDGKDVDAKQAGEKKAENKAENRAGKFIVQVAALTSKEKITELQGKLSEAGFKPMLQTVPTDAGVTTRVRVGPFASKDEAQSAMSKLDKLGLHGKLLPL